MAEEVDAGYRGPINPASMIVPPQDKIDATTIAPTGEIGLPGDPRMPSQLSSETGISGTETPYRKSPPTNIGSAAEKAFTTSPPAASVSNYAGSPDTAKEPYEYRPEVVPPTTHSTAIAAATPVNTVAPTISGTLTVGQVLTCAPGTWVPAAGSYTYRWFRGDVPLAATASTYTLVAGDSGSKMRCVVTGIDATNGGSSPASTLFTGTVP